MDKYSDTKEMFIEEEKLRWKEWKEKNANKPIAKEEQTLKRLFNDQDYSFQQ